MSATTFDSWFRTRYPEIPLASALATLKLQAEGATVPFLARYRKEQTGNLDEVALQRVLDAKERFDHVLHRQTFILEEIERQQKLTPELKERILATLEADALEDLYLPYKQKRKSKAQQARDAGLEPFADWIWNCGHGTEQPLEGQTLELWGYTFRNPEKGYPELEQVLQGAQDIVTERLAEQAELRQAVREALFQKGQLHAKKGEQAKTPSKFERYFDHAEPVAALLKPEHSHRYLAMRRGTQEAELNLTVIGPKDDPDFDERLLQVFERAALTVEDAPGAALLKKAARVAYKAYVLSAIEGELHRELKRVADEAAIRVFSENLRNLLLASPFGPRAVLGVDPGIRTGAKLALVDDTGVFLASDVIHIKTEAEQAGAKDTLKTLLERVSVRAIAVGNGTAGRETEAFLRAALREQGSDVPVVMVNEAGASVYSASAVAREEFPEQDVTVRGAISIARRLQDPLAELVKIDAKSIGVGQYQHDVAAAALKRSLELVVDSCVNQVGVNLNTASYHLLAHVSGIGPSLAKAVVSHRGERGLFRSRQELLEVQQFGPKAFEQAAGFLRIANGTHPLDNTGVHPERYAVVEDLAARLGKPLSELLGPGVQLVKTDAQLKQTLGQFTFDDLVREFEQPGRDPREQFVPFSYRDDIHELKDLKVGMLCPGMVTNVTNFGAFVDIGVHQDGLVHVSQVSDRFVKDPREVLHPGQRVEARVLEVHLEKRQIALTLKSEKKPRAAAAKPKPRPKRSVRPERRPGPQAARPTTPASVTPASSVPRAAKPQGAPPNTDRARPTDRPRPNPDRSRPQPRGSGPRPTPPPQAARPQRDETRRPQAGGGSSPKPSARPAPLNNPFAVLADFKKQLKPR